MSNFEKWNLKFLKFFKKMVLDDNGLIYKNNIKFL